METASGSSVRTARSASGSATRMPHGGHRSAISTRKGGGFYGYKIHAAVCAVTGLPLAWEVETGRRNESLYVAPLLDAATRKSEGRFETDYTKYLKADALKGARIGVARDFLGAPRARRPRRGSSARPCSHTLAAHACYRGERGGV